eukprot:tig00021326_g20308.t1
MAAAQADRDETLEAGLQTQVNLKELWRSFKAVARGYWTDPRVRWESRVWAIAVLCFAIARSGMSILYSFMGKNFWDYLSQKQAENFYRQLAIYLACFVVGVPLNAFFRWTKDQLIIRWRRWLTADLLSRYLSGRAYYRLTLPIAEGADAPPEGAGGAGPGTGTGAKASSPGVDNPDQRIASDANTFTQLAAPRSPAPPRLAPILGAPGAPGQVSVELALVVLNAVLDLVSFSYIMHSIYPPLFAVLLLYSLLGTCVSTWIGKRIAVLAFIFLRREADFRYALVRLRENAESVAFYAGEKEERAVAMGRLERLVALGMRLITWNRHLALFTIGYTVFIQVLPLAVVAPKFFEGALTLGQVQQSYSAFNHVLDDLSIVVTQVASLINLSAVAERLATLLTALDRLAQDGAPPLAPQGDGYASPTPSVSSTSSGPASEGPGGPLGATRLEMSSLLRRSWQRSSAPGPLGAPFPGPAPSSGPGGRAPGPREGVVVQTYEGSLDAATGECLHIDDLSVTTPDGARLLLSGLTYGMGAGRRLLVMGPSGSGKSSLLRTVAGLWSFGSGAVTRPADALFLPQRPYMVLGSLRDQLLYPRTSGRPGEDRPADSRLLRALEQVNLPGLTSRFPAGLDEVRDWGAVLSMGEQQRLAFARLVLAEPRLVILDEATGALDEENEAALYALLRAALPAAAVLSVGHRRALLAFHDDLLLLAGDHRGSCRLAPASSVDFSRGPAAGIF